MVKVLAIGGSGGMGRFAVREMLSCESIGSVVVADINAQSAASFASDFGGRASSLGLDVTDPVALRNALKGIDVVVNTSGPFFKFAVPILELVLRSNATTSISVMTGNQLRKCLSSIKKPSRQVLPQ